MASSSPRKANPIEPELEALVEEASDPGTSWERLWILAKHPEMQVRRALIENPKICTSTKEVSLDTGILNFLAHEFPEDVVSSPVFVMNALVEPDPAMEMVVCIISGKTKDSDLLKFFYENYKESYSVSMAVAGNHHTPIPLLVLMSDPEFEPRAVVRSMLLDNKSFPEDVMDVMSADDPDHMIRDAAYEKLLELKQRS